MSTYTDVDFLRMDASPLADSLKHHGQEWITLFGRLLHDMAKNNMAVVLAKLDKLSSELITDPSDLDVLKSVLQVSISRILFSPYFSSVRRKQ